MPNNTTGEYSYFDNKVDFSSFDGSEDVYIICSIKTSDYPDNDTKSQIVEISANLFGMDSCKMLTSNGNRLVSLEEGYIFNKDYSLDYNLLDEKDLENGLTYVDLINYFKNLWYIVHKLDAKLKIILIKNEEFQGYFEDLFKDTQAIISRDYAKNAKYFDLESLDIVRFYISFLSDFNIKIYDYQSIFEYFDLAEDNDFDYTSLNESLILSSFIYLAKQYSSLLAYDASNSVIFNKMESIKKEISTEIKRDSLNIQQYTIAYI